MTGCAANRASNAPVCRVSFDLTDDGLYGLNVQNKRAVKSFTEICKR